MNHRGVKLLLVCMIVVCANGKRPLRVGTARHVNAQVIYIEQAPYVVQLRDASGMVFCAGSLVSSQHVATAAHCFPDGKYEDITVVAGATTTSEPGVSRGVVKLSIHPSYSDAAYPLNNDVAVLKLDTPLTGGDKVLTTLELCSAPTNDGDMMQVPSWPRTHENVSNPEGLNTIRLSVLPHETCEAEVGKSDSIMCVNRKGQDNCNNLSGGPGILRGSLCAIVSRNEDCANETMPAVYTAVHAVRDFIKEKIEE